MQTLTPVDNSEREIFMDVLRGFAILGIFIANLNFLSLYSGNPNISGSMMGFQTDAGKKPGRFWRRWAKWLSQIISRPHLLEIL